MSMFESYFEFNIGEDYFYSVSDYAPTTLNREHEHEDVEEAIQEYTYNWEVVAEDYQRRRGSDKLFLVDDKHYIWCSKSGMEDSGNVVRMSSSTPENLRFKILSNLFENVAERKFGMISEGVSKEELDSDSISVTSPRQFILSKELSQEEIDAYYDDVADLTVQLLSKYYEVDSVNGLSTIVEWYDEKRTEIFREYIGFEPSILSQVLSGFEGENGWVVPSEVDEGETHSVLIHDQYQYGENMDKTLLISIFGDKKVELIEEVGCEDNVIESYEYDTAGELEAYLEEFMNYTPENM